MASRVIPEASHLLALPAENLSLVLDFCNFESLRCVNLTCKTLYDQSALRLKYRVVDISAHNIGKLDHVYDDGTVVQYWSDAYPQDSMLTT